ncbi:hypothetical protein M422DRAFT_35833, partial [Sphaerobolus stellatus SS14]
TKKLLRQNAQMIQQESGTRRARVNPRPAPGILAPSLGTNRDARGGGEDKRVIQAGTKTRSEATHDPDVTPKAPTPHTPSQHPHASRATQAPTTAIKLSSARKRAHTMMPPNPTSAIASSLPASSLYDSSIDDEKSESQVSGHRESSGDSVPVPETIAYEYNEIKEKFTPAKGTRAEELVSSTKKRRSTLKGKMRA